VNLPLLLPLALLGFAAGVLRAWVALLLFGAPGWLVAAAVLGVW
jgi:hypothetical protein